MGLPGVGLLGHVNNHGTSRPYLLDRETPQFGAKRTIIWQLWREATISEPRGSLEGGSPGGGKPIAVLLKSMRPSYVHRFCSCPCPPEARQKKNRRPGLCCQLLAGSYIWCIQCVFFAVKPTTEGWFKFDFQPGKSPRSSHRTPK